MCLSMFPEIFLGSTGNRQGTHKVFDINTRMTKKPRTVMLLLMPNHIISAINNWGKYHAKEDTKHSLVFLKRTKQLYNWDNNDLQDEEGLVDSDLNNHPGIPAKFPGINLESEQPRHHHVAKVIKASNKEQIYVTPHMVTNFFQERAVPIWKIFVFPNGDPHMVTGIPVWQYFLYGDFYPTPHMVTNSFQE
jgi:hypothetical protein